MSSPFNRPGRIVVAPSSLSPSVARLEPVEFGSPVGRRVRLSTIMGFAVIPVVCVVELAFALWARRSLQQVWLAPAIVAAVIVPLALSAQVRGYRVTSDELQVLRRNRQNRFQLDGLQSVDVDSEAMNGLIKVFGNDGLGAITGRFRNRRLGSYEALVTDRTRAVVLRWPGRCLVVSPDRPEEFAAAVRLRARLRS